MTECADAIVIGGGLHGLSAALQLARRGSRVILLERSRIGRHSSGGSAAGVRTLNRARAELAVSLDASELWHNITDLVGSDCGFQASGQLKVAETIEELAQLEDRVAGLRNEGFTHEEMVDAQAVRELAPAIAPHCMGGVYVRRDGAADPHLTLKAFLRACAEAGVIVHEGVGVRRLDRHHAVWRVGNGNRMFEAPLLVNAAGAWAGQIAAMAGDEIPVGLKASMMIVTERAEPFLRPTVSAVLRKLSFKQTAQGTVLIGGGQQGYPDLENETAYVDARALAKSAAAAVALFPCTQNLRIVRSWAGLESTTSDHVAIAGLSPSVPGLMHLFGFSGHGFQLVPALGFATAQLLLDGRTSFDLDGLSPARFLDAGHGLLAGREQLPDGQADRAAD